MGSLNLLQIPLHSHPHQLQLLLQDIAVMAEMITAEKHVMEKLKVVHGAMKQNPTATPITPPTSCVDKPKDKFLFQMKGKKNKKKPVYKNCKWLAKKPQKKIKKICKKNTDSYNGIG